MGLIILFLIAFSATQHEHTPIKVITISRPSHAPTTVTIAIKILQILLKSTFIKHLAVLRTLIWASYSKKEIKYKI